jgi:ABC-type lipoprotein export system ATPase subunit
VSALVLDRIAKQYRGPDGQVTALGDFSLEVSAGEFVAVRGPSGCGKTTLLLIAGGLLAPDSGSVLVDGEDLYARSVEERARYRSLKLGFVFQQFHLVPYLSVINNVLTAAMPIVNGERSGASRTRERAEQLIDRFGLTQRKNHVPGQLSTGERQRTALARALLNEPMLLLADEPTGNLDRDNADAVLAHLKEFTGQGGAVLLVTHDEEASRHADRQVEIGQLSTK